MKVLHLNTTLTGGAAFAALRLHRALQQEGVDSKFLSLTGNGNPSPGIFSMETDGSVPDFPSQLKKSERKRYYGAWRVRFCGKPVELFSFPESIWKIENHPLVKAADLIHLHWVAGMIDIPSFFKYVNKPVIWTLHDAWPFTCGFHYESYFNTTPFRSLIERNRKILMDAYAGKNISVVAPSAYLLDLAKKSGVFKDPLFSVIPNGLDETVFFQRVDKEVLKIYGIRENQQTWLYAGDELDYFRKGFDLLIRAFSDYKNENVRLLVAGIPGKIKLPDDPRIQLIDRVEGETKMAALLNASDLVLHTSYEDNFPNLILESLFCGTPVLSTNVGGVPELIQDGVNGILTDSTDKTGIVKAFEKFSPGNFDRAAISLSARKKFTSKIQAAKFLELYQKVIA